jgi:crotonobetainyl-CoA:carnitine CoA-transferase CaiB-like acyl-CoA transferase
LEFSQLIAAPLCGLTLLDHGAEVIKVEPPGGDYTRVLEPLLPSGESAYFHMLNRGKRGVVCDLRSAEGVAFAAALVDSADIVVESLGGVAGGLAGYDAAAERNPKLIWCTITGEGRGRPGRTIDPTLQASMGMMALTGEPDGPPMRLPVPLVDFMTAGYAVQAILAAYVRVLQGGPGALLDCAMVDAAATLASSAGVYALNAPRPLRRLGTQNNWYVPAANFRASDGAWVQVIAFGEHHWRGLCRAVDRSEWLEDPRCADNDARVSHRSLVHGWIGAIIATAPAAHWEATIVAAGGFCQRIREIEEAWADPLLAERGLVGSVSSARLSFPVPVASLARRDLPEALPAGPALGQDTATLAAEVGVRVSR